MVERSAPAQETRPASTSSSLGGQAISAEAAEAEAEPAVLQRPRPGHGAELERLTPKRRLAQGAQTGAGLSRLSPSPLLVNEPMSESEEDDSDGYLAVWKAGSLSDEGEASASCLICLNPATYVCQGLPGDDNPCRLKAALCSKCHRHGPFTGCGILCRAPRPALGGQDGAKRTGKSSCNRCRENVGNKLVKCNDCFNLHCFFCAAQWDDKMETYKCCTCLGPTKFIEDRSVAAITLH